MIIISTYDPAIVDVGFLGTLDDDQLVLLGYHGEVKHDGRTQEISERKDLLSAGAEFALTKLTIVSFVRVGNIVGITVMNEHIIILGSVEAACELFDTRGTVMLFVRSLIPFNIKFKVRFTRTDRRRSWQATCK